MRVIIRHLDETEGYLSLDPTGDLYIEAADHERQSEFAASMQNLYRFYQASRKNRLSPAEYLANLPHWLKGQTYALTEQRAKVRRRPSRIQQMLAQNAKRAAY